DRRRPRLAVVGRCLRQSPPCVGARAYLVEQHERSTRWLKQDGVPAGMALSVRLNAVCDFDRHGPSRSLMTRYPATCVRIFLARAAKPGCDEPISGFDDR